MERRVHYTFAGAERAALQPRFDRSDSRRVLLEESLSDWLRRKVKQYPFLREEEYQQEVLCKQRHLLDYFRVLLPESVEEILKWWVYHPDERVRDHVYEQTLLEFPRLPWWKAMEHVLGVHQELCKADVSKYYEDDRYYATLKFTKCHWLTGDVAVPADQVRAALDEQDDNDYERPVVTNRNRYHPLIRSRVTQSLSNSPV